MSSETGFLSAPRPRVPPSCRAPRSPWVALSRIKTKPVPRVLGGEVEVDSHPEVVLVVVFFVFFQVFTRVLEGLLPHSR